MNVKTNKPETLVLQAGLIARSTPTTIGRLAALLYGIAAYLVFSITFLYAIGFVEGLLVSKTNRRAHGASTARQSRADVDFCHTAQCYGAPAFQAVVDKIRAACSRTLDLRVTRQPGAGLPALAVAPHAGHLLARRES